MKKLFCLAIVLLAYAAISAYADSKLQSFTYAVRNRDSADLGNYTAVPKTWNDTISKQFVSLLINTADPPSDVYSSCTEYLETLVGDADSYYEVPQPNQVLINYVGDYNSNMKEPTRVQALANALANKPYPDLGNITCHVQSTHSTDSSYAYVCLEIPLNGNDHKSQCTIVWNYLNDAKSLDSFAKNTCYKKSDSIAYLEIWSTNCDCSAE